MDNLFNWFSSNKDLFQSVNNVIAVLVGFLSILLTVLTLRTNRRHNRLSVKPIANIAISDYEDCLSVKIENRGNGPLIITSFQVQKDNNVKPDIIHWMPNLPNGIYWKTFFDDPKGFTIRPSESINMIEFSLDINNKKERAVRDSIRKSLSELTVKLNYTDIYDRPMKYDERSLSYFKRNLK